MYNFNFNRILFCAFLALVLALMPMGFKWDGSVVVMDEQIANARGGGGAGGSGGIGGGPGGAGVGAGIGQGGGPAGTPGGPTSEAATSPDTSGLEKAREVVGTTPAAESAQKGLDRALEQSGQDDDEEEKEKEAEQKKPEATDDN